jgi:hypothetical protein
LIRVPPDAAPLKETSGPAEELTVSVEAIVTVVLPTTIGAVKSVTVKSPGRSLS